MQSEEADDVQDKQPIEARGGGEAEQRRAAADIDRIARPCVDTAGNQTDGRQRGPHVCSVAPKLMDAAEQQCHPWRAENQSKGKPQPKARTVENTQRISALKKQCPRKGDGWNQRGKQGDTC